MGSEEKGTERGREGSWPTPMEIFAYAPRILLALGQRNANDRLANIILTNFTTVAQFRTVSDSSLHLQ